MTRSVAVPPKADTGHGGAFCRIRLAAPGVQVDLAVPSAVPLARLLPMLLRQAGQAESEAGGWVLSTADAERLDPHTTLSEAGVPEGGLLILHSAAERTAPPVYDDVVELIAEGGVRRPWATRELRLACAALVTVAMLGTLGALAAAGGVLPGALAGGVAALLLAIAWAMSRAADDQPAATLAAALAAPAAALCAAELLGGGWGRGHLLIAGAAVLLVAAVAPAVAGGGDHVFAALGIIGLAGALGALIAILAEARPAAAAAVVAPLALAAITMLPTIALRSARLPRQPLPRTAEDLSQVPGRLDLERATRQVARARQLLSGLLAGCQAVIAVGVLVLAADQSLWSRLLAGVLALLALLRGRLFREREQVAAAVLSVTLMLLAGAGILVVRFTGHPVVLVGVLAPALAVIALLAAVIGGLTGRRRATPRLARGLDVLETTLMLGVVPLALAVWDVYRTLMDLRA
ncbi:type VII secretion integral membrane protein EccD [Dactylosporangium vinaceum]|uniref:Type VII secretion integral membrane protein EccD n=1 Tax=Dactylosporangium vinaceum TaxID=53362 RepID=A0ABV5ML42_9ACTN|nr:MULTISPECIES: type VII secretion integral membrane protein EccD [Dactylosporangium]UAB94043.1 type VII secretion integral membrane protein EccD [Dactylosporangium vinaceum]UWZ42451.1 type VII secretion integral membrane protein EccD [Dactylosporangium matsuzakiense]